MEESRNKHGRLSSEPYWQWEADARSVIEEEMKRRGIRYKQLSRLLEDVGIHESPDQLNRKVNRKRFSAAFLIACLRVMGVETITLGSLEPRRNWNE